MTPAQYWISRSRLGGGFGDSSFDELWQYANCSMSANTFVSLMLPLLASAAAAGGLAEL